MHRLLGLFYWSAVEIFLWGFLTVYLHNVGGSEFGFITVIIGAVILWNFLLRVQQGIAISFLDFFGNCTPMATIRLSFITHNANISICNYFI